MTKEEALIGVVKEMKKDITVVLIGARTGDLGFKLVDESDNISKLHLVDQWEDKETYNQVNQKAQEYGGKVQVHENDSVDDIKDGTVDLIFVDTEHYSKNIDETVEMWQSKNKKDGLFLSTQDLVGQNSEANNNRTASTERSKSTEEDPYQGRKIVDPNDPNFQTPNPATYSQDNPQQVSEVNSSPINFIAPGNRGIEDIARQPPELQTDRHHPDPDGPKSKIETYHLEPEQSREREIPVTKEDKVRKELEDKLEGELREQVEEEQSQDQGRMPEISVSEKKVQQEAGNIPEENKAQEVSREQEVKESSVFKNFGQTKKGKK